LKLNVLPLTRPAFADSSVNRRVDSDTRILFSTGVAVENTLVGHLEFALRHEGVNLEVIDAVFKRFAIGLRFRGGQPRPLNALHNGCTDPPVRAKSAGRHFLRLNTAFHPNTVSRTRRIFLEKQDRIRQQHSC
jgi:hypothetical protein